MNKHPFTSILHKHRQLAFSGQVIGDKFERLVQAQLQTDKQYANKIFNGWLWNELPSRNDFGVKDTGIDIVAHTPHLTSPYQNTKEKSTNASHTSSGMALQRYAGYFGRLGKIRNNTPFFINNCLSM